MSRELRCPAPLRRLGGVAALLAALATAACGGSTGDLSTGPSTGPGPGSQEPGGSILGVYRLSTVNGNPLNVPWETDGAFANYFTGGEIELKADGTFDRSLQGRTVIPRMNDIIHNEHWTGTWTFEPSAPGEDNGEVTLYNEDGSTDELDITQISITDVNTMPVANGTQDVIFVYVRD